MLLPTTTWGDLRAIFLREAGSAETSADNKLQDPEMFEASLGQANEDYVWPEDAKEFLEVIGEDPAAVTAAAGAPAPVEEERESPLFFTVDDDGNVLELVKDEDESISIRIDGEWVDISDEDEFPTVYEQEMKPATDDSVGAWDAELEDNQALKLKDIADYIVE